MGGSQRWKQDIIFIVNADRFEEERAAGKVLALQADIETSVSS